jgi:hypothetical protein
MKWNGADWWLGILFGVFIALNIIDGIFEPSPDAKRWIGFSAILGYLIVLMVRVATALARAAMHKGDKPR